MWVSIESLRNAFSLLIYFSRTVELGVIPSSRLLPSLPPMTAPTMGSSSVTVAPTLAMGGGILASGSAGPLTSLLSLPEETKQSKVWIGDGLPTIPRKLHDRMVQWEFIDLSELRPVGPLESLKQEQLYHWPGIQSSESKTSTDR